MFIVAKVSPIFSRTFNAGSFLIGSISMSHYRGLQERAHTHIHTHTSKQSFDVAQLYLAASCAGGLLSGDNL